MLNLYPIGRVTAGNVSIEIHIYIANYTFKFNERFFQISREENLLSNNKYLFPRCLYYLKQNTEIHKQKGRTYKNKLTGATGWIFLWLVEVVADGPAGANGFPSTSNGRVLVPSIVFRIVLLLGHGEPDVPRGARLQAYQTGTFNVVHLSPRIALSYC